MRQTFQQTSGEYSTKDIYLATVIKQAGVPIIRVEGNGRQGIFVFRACKEIEALTRDYFNGTLRVDPQGLFGAWKSLKSAAYSAIRDVR